MKKEEIWKPLPSDEKYIISNYGNMKIRNFKNGSVTVLAKIRTLASGRWLGYKSVSVRGKTKLMHRLVAETFITNPKAYKIINHKDSDRGNNYFENLEWCDQSHNCKHSYSSGTNPIEKKRGINNGRAKFDDLQIRVIKSLKGQLTQVQIANYFRRNQTSISCIFLGKNWAHI